MFCNIFSERMFLLWHWCQRGRKESSKCFGNRGESEWPNAEESWSLNVECKCCHQCQRGRLLANIEQATNACWWLLSLMATTEMAGYAEFGDLDVKAQEEQHWRKHAHWRKRAQKKGSERKKEEESVTVGSHPNFPKEPGPSDQTEAAREIFHREKPRWNPDWIWTVYLYGHVAARRAHRQFGVRDFEMSKSLVNENPEIAKRDITIWSQPLIKIESGPSTCMDTWQPGGIIGNSGIGIS